MNIIDYPVCFECIEDGIITIVLNDGEEIDSCQFHILTALTQFEGKIHQLINIITEEVIDILCIT